ALCDGLRLIGEEHPQDLPSMAQLQALQGSVLQRAARAQATRLPSGERAADEDAMAAGVAQEPAAPYQAAAEALPDDGIPVLTETVLVDETLLPMPASDEQVELVD